MDLYNSSTTLDAFCHIPDKFIPLKQEFAHFLSKRIRKMNTTIKINGSTLNIAALLMFLALLLCLRWVWFEVFPTARHPEIVNGVLDLRGRNLQQSASLPLDGEWEFFSEKLYNYNDIDSIVDKPNRIQVPGDWRSGFPDKSASSYGYGTYRLRILTDPLESPVSFWFQKIEAASVAEINGFVDGSPGKGNIGKPADHPKEYIPKRLSYTSTYTERGTQELVVLIRVANFENPYKGGILHSIRFGSQAAIDTERWYSIGFQLVTFIVLLLHGLYACILYLLNRSERSLLLFCLLILSAAISVVSDYDNLLMLWIPFNYGWALKIRMLSYLWTAFFFLYFCRSFLAITQGGKWFFRFTAVLSSYSVFLALSPPWLVHATESRFHIFILFYIFPFCWGIFDMLRAHRIKQPAEGTIFLLLTTAAILSNVAWGFLDEYLEVTLVYYPIDLIAAIISFSTFWFKKFFRNTQENLKLNRELQEADKLKDQFLTNTSHELRTPLHGIMNIAETILHRESERLSETGKKDMALMVTISRRMSALLSDLLDAAQLRERRLKLKTKPLHIQSVVPAVVSMLGYMHESKPIRMTVDIGTHTPAVIADEQRIVQILHNLLHNALKFTEKGTVSVTAELHGSYVWIHVADTGVGMDEETLARIFLPYEQGIHGFNDGRGIGLGLSICQQLIELHGGQLTVRSEPGRGSVFSFSLPADDTQAATPAEITSFEMPDTARSELAIAESNIENQFDKPPSTDRAIHILAVDDDPVNLNVLKAILSSEPYVITTANSAVKALQLLETGQWDLLVVDVMMPNMSGYDLTRKVREQFSLSELPVLLLTARTQPTDIYTGFLSGANDYVTKPVDGLELKYRIRALTGLKQSVHDALRMEAAYLQAQIQPHFIFNTLNSIMALSISDMEKMRKLMDAFVTYLRISFDFLNTRRMVELVHELELVHAYLYVEQERFGERLTIQWDVRSEHPLRLPPLTIQPLVENAVKHGLLGQLKGLTVLIRVVRQEGVFLVEVQDNGKGMDGETVNRLLREPNRSRNGIGLYNTNRRLVQIYGHGLSIRSKPGEGTSVSFLIPGS